MCQARILGSILAALLCAAPPPASAQTSDALGARGAPADDILAQAPVRSGTRGQTTDTARQRQVVPRAAPTAVTSESEETARANLWTIGLAAGLPEGLFLRFGAEIARNLNEAEPLRVLPIVTPGATGNVKDLLHLRGVDLAITHSDVLEHFRKREPIPNLERRVAYVSELYISEVHLLVRPEINSIKDLAGKKVSFHTKGAGPTVTGPILFERLGVKVEPVYVNNAIALEQMKTGEIAALLHTVGKPVELFAKYKNEAGLKFLPIPFEPFDDYYVPSTLTAEDYPAYMKPGEKVDVIGVPALLAVYNWPREHERFRRLSRFIDVYMERFAAFRQPPYHPKWKDINLAGKVPGWQRYWYVDEKLSGATPPAPAAGAALKSGDPADDKLYKEFLAWKKAQAK